MHYATFMPPIFTLTCTDPEHKYIGSLHQLQEMLSDLAYIEDKPVDIADSPTLESVIAMADIVWDLPADEIFLTPTREPLTQ